MNIDKSEQMYFDHGSDSFLSEVGQILRIDHVDIRIYQQHPKVRIIFSGWHNVGAEWSQIRTEQWGRSYGECLRKIREKIREETGR